MSHNEDEMQYLRLMTQILETGEERCDRTGVGTLSIFAPNPLRFDLTNGKIPLFTTKMVPWKTVIIELLWFLRGQTDVKLLQEQNVKIWDGNSSRDFLDGRNLSYYPTGVIEPSYGWNFRYFGASYNPAYADPLSLPESQKYNIGGFDQIKYIENLLKTDPFSRRIYMSNWNGYQLDELALPCCHSSIQFYVSEGKNDGKKYLHCHLMCRSQDFLLGNPFNVASYSIVLGHYLSELFPHFANFTFLANSSTK